MGRSVHTLRATVRRLRTRHAARVFCAACLAIPLAASPQSPPPGAGGASGGNVAVSAPAAQAPYVDQLIGGGELAPLVAEGRADGFNAEGPPRYYRVEGVASNISGSGTNSYQYGVRFSGFVETQSYGVLSADASLQNGGGSSTLTIAQRAVPFDGGWRANNVLGVTYTPGIDLTRSQYRFYLPSFPIVGVTTEWIRNDDLQLQAAIGQPGNFDGILIPGFSSLHGTFASVGAQWNFAPRWQAGVEITDSRDVNIAPGLDGPGASFSGQSYYGTLAWQGSDTRLQFNVLDTAGDRGRSGVGLWLDGATRGGRFVHHYGIYRFEPQLFFGYQQVNSNQQGGYYRVNYQSQQWLWDASLEALEPVSGSAPNAVYLSGSVNYLVDRQLSVGGSATVRQFAGTAWSGQAFVEKNSEYGSGRLQFSAAAQDSSNNGQQLQYDHTWALPLGTRLTTGIAGSRETIAGATFNTASLLVYGGGNITDNLTLDGNARINYTRNNGSATGAYINANATWRIDPHWSVIATAYDNRDDTARLFVITPPSQETVPVPTQRSRAFFLTIRFEDRAGTARAPIGGAPGAGAGSVVGYVFLDANDDGRRNAGESGAANLTVMLDGRFAARTDGQGRFEFPHVTAGPHTLTVVPDNLPLPWAVGAEGRQEIQVRTRETTTLEIPAARLK